MGSQDFGVHANQTLEYLKHSPRPLTKSNPERGCVGVEGHQPQHARSCRALRLVSDTAALREGDFGKSLETPLGKDRR